MKKGSSTFPNACSVNNRIRSLFDVSLLPRQSAVCLVIDQSIRTASSGVSSQQSRSNADARPQITTTNANDDDGRVKQIVLYDDDPLEMVFSSGLCYDVLAQIAWCTFHIVIFLALLIAIRTLIGWLMAKLMRKRKTADATSELTATTAMSANALHFNGIPSMVNAVQQSANDWNSEYVVDDHLCDNAGGAVALAKKSSFHIKRNVEINAKKRDCVSAGPVISNLKKYEFDFNVMKMSTKTDHHSVAKTVEKTERPAQKISSAYYVCVILLFCYSTPLTQGGGRGVWGALGL